ncbi:sensor histidine kinase [Gordonia sp. (in: high G+C Gram-positive bacteria)]|uniref:sensor histidine kinase n=1 Tax=Gordonia sp. (in: high G+C Gram-positive bacteria) TaxID=84139 RepID=UPI003F9D9734
MFTDPTRAPRASSFPPGQTPEASVRDRLITLLNGGEDGRSSLRTFQAVGSAIVGGSYLVYLVAASGSFARFGDLAAPWWLPMSIAVVIASGLGLAWVGVSGRLDWLLPVAVSAAIAYLVVMTLWFVAWGGVPTGIDEGSPTIVVWFTMLPELACVALVLAERPVLAFANLIVAGALSEAVGSFAWTGVYGWDSILRTFWSTAWGAVFLAVGIAAVSFAWRLDQTRSATIETARDLVREDTLDVDRRRADALVHDRIIAFLLALHPGRPSAATQSAANGVLHELDHWWDAPDQTDVRLDAREFVGRLRATVMQFGDAVGVRADIDASAAADYDGGTTSALLDATAEAVRNFYRHAGRDASCVVLGQIGDDAITVTVADDGAGFDPEGTPPGRVGVSFGITGRMAVIPGGSSSVLSAPGHGTRVRVRWERP